MKLFLEHDDPNSCRSAWEPSADDPVDVAAMHALGWQRIPSTTIPDLVVATNGHTDPDAIDDPDEDARVAKPTVVVVPCSAHMVYVPGCSRCVAWREREEQRLGSG